MAAPIASPLPASTPEIVRTVADATGGFNGFLNTPLINTASVTLTVGALLGALVALLIAVVASWLIRYGLKRYADRHASNQSTLYTLSRIVHYIVLIVGVLIALNVAGIPFSQFAVFAGALGVGLGFGLQAIFSNFISGLIILFDRSLKVGDYVELANGVHGEVRDIHIRATRVTTNDNIDILIPNSKFITDNVVNLTWRDASRRSHIAFRVPYGADKDEVRHAALEAAAEVPFTVTGNTDRTPQVWLTGFGESAMEFALVVWLNADAAKRYQGVTAAYNWALHNALEKYHLELPFPQRDLHVKTWLGLSGQDARGDLREHLGGSAADTAGEEPPALPRATASAPTENDAVQSIARDIARDTAAQSKPDDATGGIRERAQADQGDSWSAAQAQTEEKGR